MDSEKSKNNAVAETGAAKKEARRKVLRNTLIGGAVISTGAMPEKWRKPALEAVILPAHAATTDDTGAESGGVTTAPTTLPPATTCIPSEANFNCNAQVNFSFSNWTDPIA